MSTQIKLVDETTEENITQDLNNPLVSLQEGIDYNDLQNIFEEWGDKEISSKEELEFAKKQKNKLVKVRTSIEKKRKEIVTPVQQAIKKIKSHSDGLQSMVFKVEDRIKEKILAYEKEELIRIQKEIENKRSAVNSILDPIIEEFNSIKSIDDCNFIKEELSKYSPDEFELGPEVYSYAMNRKAEISGKLMLVKEKLMQAKIDELESIKKEDAKPVTKVEVKPQEIDPSEISPEEEEYQELYKSYSLGMFEEYQSMLNSIPKNKIYTYLRWVIKMTNQDEISVVEMLRFLTND